MFLEQAENIQALPGSWQDNFKKSISGNANCGYWSAYSLSLVGQSGEVHAFEPVPQYFAFVRRGSPSSIPGYRVIETNQVACGARPGGENLHDGEPSSRRTQTRRLRSISGQTLRSGSSTTPAAAEKSHKVIASIVMYASGKSISIASALSRSTSKVSKTQVSNGMQEC